MKLFQAEQNPSRELMAMISSEVPTAVFIGSFRKAPAPV